MKSLMHKKELHSGLRSAIQETDRATFSTEPVVNYTIPYFPLGAPDERIDSRVARYHVQQGTRATETTYRTLFESAPFSFAQWLPPKLERLAKKLPGDQAANLSNLYNQSTLLPLFEMYCGYRLNINYEEQSNVVAVGNARWTTSETATTQLCMSCLIDDEEEHGWPYIHRSHHIPGVTACAKHGMKLMDRCPACSCPFEPPNKLVLVPWRACACGAHLSEIGPSAQVKSSEYEIRYACFTKGLLDRAPIRVTSLQLQALYRSQAIALGFGKKSLINRSALFNAIEDHVGHDLLAKIDKAYKMGRTETWFHVLGQQNNEAPLYRHLIISEFLFEKAEIFVEKLSSLTDQDLPANASSKGQSSVKRAANSNISVMKEEDLLADLIAYAKAQGLDLEGLWKTRYREMKRLVKKHPDAVQIVIHRLAQFAKQKGGKPASKQKGSRPLNPNDRQWSQQISNAARELYASSEKPMRISKNALRKAVGIPGNWPDPASLPLTVEALNIYHETVWHFYARRLAWKVRTWKGKSYTVRQLVEGVDYYRMQEVYAVLNDKFPIILNSDEPICALLSSFGVDLHWGGPPSGQYSRRAGRAYIKTGRPKKIKA